MSTSFNFPANPTLNQIVTLPDGNQAQWNGSAWVSVTNNVTYPLPVASGGTGATNPLTAKRNLAIPIWTLDDAAPAAPVFGDRWIRPGSMTEVVWLPNANPGGGGVWVNLADAGSVAYPIPVSKGGTGATTAAGARTNLGIDPLIAALLPLDGSRAMTGALKLADGTVAAPGLAFNSEPGLGWYRIGASQVGMAAQGGSVLNFKASTGGTVEEISPLTASKDSQLLLYNQPYGAALKNYLALIQHGDGSALLATGNIGAITRGNLTIDAPLTSMTGALGVADVITTRPTSTVGGKQASFQNILSINLAPGVETTFTMSGMLLVNDINGGGIALFLMGGGYVSLMGDPATFSTVLGTAGKMNCAFYTGSGGPFYTFKNETSTTRSIALMFFKTREAV